MYLKWKTKKIDDFSDKNIEQMYDFGFLFGRNGRGQMYQSRSVRIDLNQFSLSSENRRVIKKNENLQMMAIPLPFDAYHWSIHKMGSTFYSSKFGAGVFTANKIKELMTDKDKSNFNIALEYKMSSNDQHSNEPTIGYCICLETENLLHYSYPFYNLNNSIGNIGMGMMLKAILYALKHKKRHIYIGTASRPTDSYKLQFSWLEWFDGEKWNNNIEAIKKILLETKL
ncbi:MAG: hypothetical protein ABH832_01515 [bacterium]